jgi:hypothetical protein
MGDIAARSGPKLNKRLPRVALDLVRRAAGESLGPETVVVFVSDSCPACSRLLASIENPTRTLPSYVIVSASSSEGFSNALDQLTETVVHDDGTVWQACNIQATPFIVTLDQEGVVRHKTVNHEMPEPMQWQLARQE